MRFGEFTALISIRFTQRQRRYAIEVGRARYAAPDLHRIDRHGAKRSLAIDILGAAGELAVSVAYSLPWDTQVLTDEFSQPDFAPDIQVRTSGHPRGRLILFHASHDEQRFIFVSCQEGVFTIHDWIWGWEGKHENFWRDPGTGRPAFFVPVSYIDKGWPTRQSP